VSEIQVGDRVVLDFPSGVSPFYGQFLQQGRIGTVSYVGEDTVRLDMDILPGDLAAYDPSDYKDWWLDLDEVRLVDERV
jgi:hypothetical protein